MSRHRRRSSYPLSTGIERQPARVLHEMREVHVGENKLSTPHHRWIKVGARMYSVSTTRQDDTTAPSYTDGDLSLTIRVLTIVATSSVLLLLARATRERIQLNVNLQE